MEVCNSPGLKGARLQQQAGLDKAQQCAHLRAWVECWTQLPGELDDAAMRKLEDFVEGQSVLRYVLPTVHPSCACAGFVVRVVHMDCSDGPGGAESSTWWKLSSAAQLPWHCVNTCCSLGTAPSLVQQHQRHGCGRLRSSTTGTHLPKLWKGSVCQATMHSSSGAAAIL